MRKLYCFPNLRNWKSCLELYKVVLPCGSPYSLHQNQVFKYLFRKNKDPLKFIQKLSEGQELFHPTLLLNGEKNINTLLKVVTGYCET